MTERGKGPSVPHRLRVAYILHRFPHLTETFIMREMYWLRQHDVEVQIYSLLDPRPGPVHEQARELLPYVKYSPFFSWRILGAQIGSLTHSPRRYFLALAKTIWQTYREPGVLLRALAVFPKSVHIARQMEGQHVHHVHAHFAWLEGIAAGIVADLTGITFTIHPHAFGLFGRNQRDVRSELENATRVVAISQYHREYITALCPHIDPDTIEVVHCGLDTGQFRPAPRDAAGRPVRILAVGSLIEKKGHEYLIDACALLAQRGLSFECDIVGRGPLQGALQTRIDKHGLHETVRLLGALEQARVAELYQTADVFALPCVVARGGDRDGIPVALMEAMACELPVVTTAVAGIPELVGDGVTGLFVEQREARSLADALERLIADESMRRQLGSRGRQTIVQGFQIQQNTAKLAGLFRNIVALHRHAA